MTSKKKINKSEAHSVHPSMLYTFLKPDICKK